MPSVNNVGLTPEFIKQKEAKEFVYQVKGIEEGEISSFWLYLNFIEFKEFMRLCSAHCANLQAKDTKRVFDSLGRASNNKIKSLKGQGLKDISKEFLSIIQDKVKSTYNIFTKNKSPENYQFSSKFIKKFENNDCEVIWRKSIDNAVNSVSLRMETGNSEDNSSKLVKHSSYVLINPIAKNYAMKN